MYNMKILTVVGGACPQFFDELSIPAPDYNLGISGGSHGEMTGRMLIEIEKVLQKEQPDCSSSVPCSSPQP